MKVLRSHSAIHMAKLGTRVRDASGDIALRVQGGWVYEASSAPGLFRAWELLAYAPLTVLEVVELAEGTPPAPRTPSRVIGRFYWDPTHSTPWVSFDTITQYRTWATAVRKALPGTPVEMAYVDLSHNASSLLRGAQDRAEEYRRS